MLNYNLWASGTGSEAASKELEQKLAGLKESEEKYRTIAENVDDVIFQLSPLGFIQYVSPKVKELYGYKPEDLVGKHLRKTTPLSEVPKALEALKTVLSGKAVRNFEINQLDSKGKIVPMEINITPVIR
jgi:PAS domain S-box-containing protein